MLVFNNLEEMKPYYKPKTNTYEFIDEGGEKEDIKINFDLIIEGNINAGDINAWDINYYAVCFAYRIFKCKSIKSRRENSRHFCLDNEIEYID